MIDLWKSRRKNYLECYFWERNENEDYVEENELVYNQRYSGFFMAEEVSSLTVSPQQISDTFMFPEQTITLLTHDCIDNLKENDIVEIKGINKKFRVDSIQRANDKKQRFFIKEGYSASHYISLRG